MIRHLLVLQAVLALTFAQKTSINLTLERATETTITLRWPANPANFQNFTLKYGEDFNQSVPISVPPAVEGTPVTQTIDELEAGQQYTFQLFGFDTTDITDKFLSELTQATKPYPPISVNITGAGNTSLTLTWLPEDSSTQDSYVIRCKDLSSPPTTHDDLNTNNTEITIFRLNAGHRYTVTVAAVSFGVESNKSAEKDDNTVPFSPVSINVIVNITALEVTWSPHPNSTQESYEVSYEANSVVTSADCGSSVKTSCVITAPQGHEPGQLYLIKVKSVQGQRSSLPVSTTSNTKPLPPVFNDTADVTTEQLTLSWHLTSGTVDGYRVSIDPSDSANSVQNKTASELTAVFNGLVAGRRYEVTLISVAGVEQSVRSTNVYRTVPSSPNATVTVQTNDSISLALLPFSGEVSSYTVVARTISKNVPGNETSVTLTGLIPGDTYNINVTANSGNQTSEPTVINEVTTNPNPVEQLDYVADMESVLISWSRPNPPNSIFKDYQVDISRFTPKIVVTESESVNISNLTSGVQYTVTIYARSGAERRMSEPASINVTTIPSSVENLSVLADTEMITVSWTVPDGIIYHYLNVTISDNDGHTDHHVINHGETETTHKFIELKPGKVYQVAIFTAIIDGPVSKPVTTVIATKPLPVTLLRADPPLTNEVVIHWQVEVDSHRNGFKITVVDLSDEAVPVSHDIDSTLSRYTVTGLQPGRLYNITLSAYTNYTAAQIPQQQFSDGESLSLNTKPLPVLQLDEVVQNDSSISLTWQASPGSTQDRYLVKYRSVLRDPNSSWKNIFTQNLSHVLPAFPGEKYEIQVVSMSGEQGSNVTSTESTTFPLAPSTITVLRDRTETDKLYIKWVYESNQTYAEKWNVTFGSLESAQTEKTVHNMSNPIEVDLPNLGAGQTYIIDVYTITYGETKSLSSVQANGTVKPVCDTDLSESAVSNVSLCLNYSENSPTFNTYYFQLGALAITKDRTEDRLVCFPDLIPGTLYTLNVSVISVHVTSDVKPFSFRTVPNRAMLDWTIEQTKIELSLSRPLTGVSDFYNVSCHRGQGEEAVSCGFRHVLATDKPQLVNFTQLKPWERYHFEILTISGDKYAKETVSQDTKQSTPSMVREVKASVRAPNTVLVKWEEPEFPNGVLNKYYVNYTGVLGDEMDSGERVLHVDDPPGSINVTISELRAGYQYTFWVRAFTISYGPPGEHTIPITTYAPPFKDNLRTEDSVPKKLDKVKPTSIKLKFVNAFSSKGGPILSYTIIVSRDNYSENNSPMLPGWRIARNDPAISAYQAIKNCTNFFEESSDCFTMTRKKRSVQAETQDFVVGTETGCDQKDYCNGPLNPDTIYYFALRAFTSGGYTDTYYSSPIKTAALPVEENPGPLIGGIVGAAVALVLIVVLVLVFYRIMKRRPSMYKKDDHEMHEDIPVKRSSSRHTRVSHIVKLVDFPEHFHSMSADSDYRFAEEFEELREVGREQSCNAAELPQNRAKNRFTNILPYDHSRVKLLPTDDEEGSDYINSNYMPGYTSRREYIVTQGPLPSTRDDFWRLLWEQNACSIVMLTRCMEKGREKCDHYWPPNSEIMFYGDLQVAILNETKFPDWTITEFKISLGDHSRKVRHFHYTAWPDFGVPERPNSLVKFVNTARGKFTSEGGPILVHCSAGVGRSGTFIALDRILQHIKQNDGVDIYSVVHEMRRHRVWMVQTEQQYICIHQCLLSVLQGLDDEPIYCNQIHDNIGFEDDEGINVEIM